MTVGTGPAATTIHDSRPRAERRNQLQESWRDDRLAGLSRMLSDSRRHARGRRWWAYAPGEPPPTSVIYRRAVAAAKAVAALLAALIMARPTEDESSLACEGSEPEPLVTQLVDTLTAAPCAPDAGRVTLAV